MAKFPVRSTSVPTFTKSLQSRASDGRPEARPTPAATIAENRFYYFAYGSCMCPVDLKRSLGENTHQYVIGPATLKGYRLGFHYYSAQRNCGALDILPDAHSEIHGVLYALPGYLLHSITHLMLKLS